MKKFLDYLPSILIVLGYFTLIGILGFFLMFFEKSEFEFVYVLIIVTLGIYTLTIVDRLNRKNKE